VTPKKLAPNPITLVGSLGVASMPLIGGRYDGGTWVAVVGCPVCIPVKPAKLKKEESVSARYMMTFWSSGPAQVEGEEWKGESTQGAPENRAKRFALYAPHHENGKASLALYFVGEIEKETQP
jgi:hypothetical protein